ncbi:hypothetical protein AGLY_009446 [Aphis glycines]|uniref:Uncharacterized protein n=1 Tax=Aphis glycines TaxID=307491 RepID=A0A6G0TIB8_APHGL|nr:hypothetical protein AGLY_009446 [Aphis glycines]
MGRINLFKNVMVKTLELFNSSREKVYIPAITSIPISSLLSSTTLIRHQRENKSLKTLKIPDSRSIFIKKVVDTRTKEKSKNRTKSMNFLRLTLIKLRDISDNSLRMTLVAACLTAIIKTKSLVSLPVSLNRHLTAGIVRNGTKLSIAWVMGNALLYIIGVQWNSLLRKSLYALTVCSYSICFYNNNITNHNYNFVSIKRRTKTVGTKNINELTNFKTNSRQKFFCRRYHLNFKWVSTQN